MIFLTDATSIDGEVSYATFELAEIDIQAIRAAHAALLVLLESKSFTALRLHIDAESHVQFWPECEFDIDMETDGAQTGEAVQEEVGKNHYALLSKMPTDLVEDDDVFCEGVELVICAERFYFVGFGDDTIMDSIALPYSVLDAVEAAAA